MHTDSPTPRVVTEYPIETLAGQLANSLSGVIEDAVEEGVRRANLPEYMPTARAVKETGLKARALKHLRETGRVSWRKPKGTILYKTSELFREIDRSKIPAILA